MLRRYPSARTSHPDARGPSALGASAASRRSGPTGAVALGGDLPGPVVELDLLERGRRAVAPLGRAPGRRAVDRVGLVALVLGGRPAGCTDGVLPPAADVRNRRPRGGVHRERDDRGARPACPCDAGVHPAGCSQGPRLLVRDLRNVCQAAPRRRRLTNASCSYDDGGAASSWNC